LEASSFKPSVGDSEFGSRIAITQPIRLWGVANDKKSYSNAQTQLLKSKQKQTRSIFIYNISIEYLHYIYKAKELELTKQSLSLATNIFNISDSMFKAGAISKGEMLQAKMAFNNLESQMAMKKYLQTRAYYKLLRLSNITQDIDIDTNYIFELKSKSTLNPQIEVLQSAVLKAEQEAILNSNKLEWIDLVAEYEAEPNDDIFRFGVSIPLTLFNTNTERKEIALLEAEKQGTLVLAKQTIVAFELKQLVRELDELKILKQTHEELLKNEIELLKMFEEGYKIANVNLLSLQQIKNSVIQTKENILNIELSLQLNIIKTNYLQGSLNE